MSTNQQTSKQYFNALQIIFFTWMAGLVMFTLNPLFVIQSSGADDGQSN